MSIYSGALLNFNMVYLFRVITITGMYLDLGSQGRER